MQLEDIAEVSELESVNMECKSRLSRDDVEGWLKTIAGFQMRKVVLSLLALKINQIN